MKADTAIHHVALQCSDRGRAELFFDAILGIPRQRSFALSAALSDAIFGVREAVEVDVYDNGSARFEIFTAPDAGASPFAHTCIEVDDRQQCIARCRQHGIEPSIIREEGKDLLFVRDFSGNLFEVKQR